MCSVCGVMCVCLCLGGQEQVQGGALAAGRAGGATGSPAAPAPAHPFRGLRLLLFLSPSAQGREGKREQERQTSPSKMPLRFLLPSCPETLCPASAWGTEVSGHSLSKQLGSGPRSTKQTSVFFSWKKCWQDTSARAHSTVKAEDAAACPVAVPRRPGRSPSPGLRHSLRAGHGLSASGSARWGRSHSGDVSAARGVPSPAEVRPRPGARPGG